MTVPIIERFSVIERKPEVPIIEVKSNKSKKSNLSSHSDIVRRKLTK